MFLSERLRCVSPLLGEGCGLHAGRWLSKYCGLWEIRVMLVKMPNWWLASSKCRIILGNIWASNRWPWEVTSMIR